MTKYPSQGYRLDNWVPSSCSWSYQRAWWSKVKTRMDVMIIVVTLAWEWLKICWQSDEMTKSQMGPCVLDSRGELHHICGEIIDDCWKTIKILNDVQNNVQFQCFLMSLSKVKFGSEQFVATPDNVFFPLQWVIIIISIITMRTYVLVTGSIFSDPCVRLSWAKNQHSQAGRWWWIYYRRSKALMFIDSFDCFSRNMPLH